jgi:Kef-type K+ transport system membrane component KefB
VSVTAAPHDHLALLGALALVIVAARLGAALMRRFGQPEVLGELLAGVLVGNLGLLGLHAFDRLSSLPGLDLLAQLGVLFLLFMVGLESDLGQMIEVGSSSVLVAIVGVIVPSVLGFLVSRGLQGGHPALAHVFVGATLCATSVGITARVLSDLGRSGSAEGRIILGAAVIDDVLGLMVLAAVTGMISAAGRGVPFGVAGLGVIVAKAVGFLLGAVLIGRFLSRQLFRFAARLEIDGLLISLALALLFALAWVAGLLGLAPLVGAFAAGLVLEEGHYAKLRARDRQHRSVHQLLEPLASFLTPIFFVLMGLRVDLAAFVRPGVPLFALALTVAAVIGKQACGLGVLARGVDRVAVGLGMIPRGEVGLIFAGIGSGLTLGAGRVIDGPVYSAMVAMVTLTTLVAPPLLAWRLRRR